MAGNNVPPIPQDKIEENPRWREWFRNLGSYISQVQGGGTFAQAGDNYDITSLNALTTPLPISEGGTGATNAAQARINLGIIPSTPTLVPNSEYQSASAGQTVFNISSFTYVVGSKTLYVYVNGSKQINTVNYTETSTSSITFVTGLNVGDLVEFVI
jgi:hypothetical protein